MTEILMHEYYPSDCGGGGSLEEHSGASLQGDKDTDPPKNFVDQHPTSEALEPLPTETLPAAELSNPDEASVHPSEEDIEGMQHEVKQIVNKFRQQYVDARHSVTRKPDSQQQPDAPVSHTEMRRLLFGESWIANEQFQKELRQTADINRYQADAIETFIFPEVELNIPTGTGVEYKTSGADFTVIHDKKTGIYAAFDVTDAHYNEDAVNTGVASFFGKSKEEALEQAKIYLEHRLQVPVFDVRAVRQTESKLRNFRIQGVIPEDALIPGQFKSDADLYAFTTSPEATQLLGMLDQLARQGLSISHAEINTEIEMSLLSPATALLSLAQKKLENTDEQTYRPI